MPINHYITLFAISLTLQYLTISLLKKQSIFQKIYTLSPKSHQKKSKTPSFGGIPIILTLLIGTGYFALWSPKVTWLVGLTTTFALIGFYDDFFAKQKNENKGLSPTQKFSLQLITATGFVLFFNLEISPLSPLMIAFSIFIIVGTSNATNLTDGLDGLLTGTAIITAIGFLQVLIGIHPHLTQVLIILITGLIAFLLVNKYPAKIFMGDTGALAIGAFFSGLATCIGNPWILIPFGAVYIIETLSVIIQVVVFKKTGKRVFKMAPLHHHFELLGMSEKQVVLLFWSLAASFVYLYIKIAP